MTEDRIPGFSSAVWQNRIVGYGEESPEDLLANPFNWRIHPREQQEAVEASIETVGWIETVIVNRTTGHVLDGHLRVTLAMRHDEPTIPVQYVELTEEQEKIALAVLDHTAGMAVTDGDKLNELLAEIGDQASPLQRVLDELRTDADLSALMAEMGAQLAKDGGGSWQVDGVEREATIRPVVWVRQLATVEQAIRATGNADRGEALVELCTFYLEHNGDKKG